MTLEEINAMMIESEKSSVKFCEDMIAVYDQRVAYDNDVIKEYRAGGWPMREFLADWIESRKEDYKERNYWRRKLQKHQRYLYVLECR